MNTNREVLKTLHSVARNPYAWPGGYGRRLVLTDGEVLCHDCVQSNYAELYRATRDGERNGWAVAGEYIPWEGPADYCAHCGAELPTVYGDPDPDQED